MEQHPERQAPAPLTRQRLIEYIDDAWATADVRETPAYQQLTHPINRFALWRRPGEAYLTTLRADWEPVRAEAATCAVAHKSAGARRESHGQRPGHRRVRAARAGPDDEPADPAPRRAYLVDEHFCFAGWVQ